LWGHSWPDNFVVGVLILLLPRYLESSLQQLQQYRSGSKGFATSVRRSTQIANTPSFAESVSPNEQRRKKKENGASAGHVSPNKDMRMSMSVQYTALAGTA
jgi:phage gpG-like protein